MSIFEENNREALPKQGVIKPDREEKHFNVINEARFTPNSDIRVTTEWGDSEPRRPFTESTDIIEHDARLELSLDTYVQMILGTGIQVKAKTTLLENKIKKWFNEINMEERVEDGLYSYVGQGNLFWEIEPNTFSDFVEIPIDTVKGIIRDKKGNIKYYVQFVNNKQIKLDPNSIIQYKFSNARQELWGRGIFHSIINEFTDPHTGVTYQAPIFAMKDIEDGLVKIVQNYASPIMMFYFKDAGPNFIEKQGDALKKARPGAKILTDKEFDIKIFETGFESKFDKYIEHIQKNVLEPGSQFPLGFFNAQFTARAASETSDSVMIRKIKRIQKRFANQLKEKFVLPYLKKQNKNIDEEDFDIVFEFDNKTDFNITQLLALYRDNGIKRSELRQNLSDHTNIKIDLSDMEDLLPITSVTPTDRFGQSQNTGHQQPEPIPQRDPVKEIDKEEKLKEKELKKIERAEKKRIQEELHKEKLDVLKKIKDRI